MKTTEFNKKHKELGAKMVEFVGFEMPVEYSGINDEHINIRENVGVFDVSHMGEIWVKGPNAYNFVQKVTSNDISKISVGEAQYSCFPNNIGGIVDDLIVYYYESEKYLLVVNASNIEKDWNWLVKQNSENAELENASDNISQLAVQGPNAEKVLQKLTDVDLSKIKFYTFVNGEMAGVKDVIISATGYTGAGGFELYMYNNDAEKIWDAVFDAGKEFNIKPAGLAARDTLRLEMGYCLYGNDINDTSSPIEAGLGWITKFDEKNNFINRKQLEEQKITGVDKRLRGFEMIDRGIPRKDYEIYDSENSLIGNVTSGTMSPMLKKGIGMGYINKGSWNFDNEIYIKVRKKMLKAKIVKLPFYKA
ncbi:MAG: glycine cleavage system aminomethyltransferase GcvT [Bacteroidales bacterium]|nr:glycine cleavage system aminomethyltransferase GcvT [Bacteroidales bacterium]